jgi:lipopolysaccharide export system permease protein
MAQMHGRVTAALLCVIAALVGFCTLLVGVHSRFGVWRQVLVAFGLLVGIKIVESLVIAPVLVNGALWPLLYLPALIGLGLSAILLTLASYPGLLQRLRRKAPAAEAAT